MSRRPYGKEKRTEQIAVKAPPSIKAKLTEIAESHEWTLSQSALKMIELGLSMYEQQSISPSLLRQTA
jgi:hypothetical protein